MKKLHYVLRQFIGVILLYGAVTFVFGQTKFDTNNNLTPQYGGIAAIAVNASDLSSLNNTITSTVGPIYIAPLWGDGLLSTDGEGKLVYRLAKDIQISSDLKNYQISLKEGLKWSDGHPFTAEDIEFNLTQMTKYNRSWKVGKDYIETIKVTDSHSLNVILKSPFAPMLRLLDRSALTLLPKHIYSQGDPSTNSANRKPVGMGPYRIAKWVEGRRIEFERNPFYWDKPRPYLDGVVVALIPSEQQQANALLNGEINWVMLGSSQVKRVETEGSKKNVNVWRPKYGTPAIMLIDFNVTRPPFSNPAVRQALYKAIDRDRILSDAYEGIGKVAKSAIPQDFIDLYNPIIDYTKLYAYDPEAAGAMLDKAGFPIKDGHRFSVKITTASGIPSDPVDATLRIIVANWQKIGIKVDTEQFELGAYGNKVYKERNFDVNLIALSAELDPVLGIDRSYTCNETRLGYVNPTGFCDPELDKIARAAGTAASDKRKALYGDYEKRAAMSLPQAPLIEAVKSQGVGGKLHGLDQEFNISFSTNPNWSHVWYSK